MLFAACDLDFDQITNKLDLDMLLTVLYGTNDVNRPKGSKVIA